MKKVLADNTYVITEIMRASMSNKNAQPVKTILISQSMFCISPVAKL